MIRCFKCLCQYLFMCKLFMTGLHLWFLGLLILCDEGLGECLLNIRFILNKNRFFHNSYCRLILGLRTQLKLCEAWRVLWIQFRWNIFLTDRCFTVKKGFSFLMMIWDALILCLVGGIIGAGPFSRVTQSRIRLVPTLLRLRTSGGRQDLRLPACQPTLGLHFIVASIY